jgi:nucleoside phosphorylase
MPPPSNPTARTCSLLLFLATPAEEKGLKEAARHRDVPFEKGREPIAGEQYHDLGTIGDETVFAICPVRVGGALVMGSIGNLGTASRGLRFRIETGATSIVQIGTAFGTDPHSQKLGDVLVSKSIIPYDDRTIKPSRVGWLRRRLGAPAYVTEYRAVIRFPAREELIETFRRESTRYPKDYSVHLGAVLSGGLPPVFWSTSDERSINEYQYQHI